MGCAGICRTCRGIGTTVNAMAKGAGGLAHSPSDMCGMRHKKILRSTTSRRFGCFHRTSWTRKT